MFTSFFNLLLLFILAFKWRDVDFNQSEKGIKSKIDISLILTNQNLSVKNGENNGVLAGVPFCVRACGVARSHS